MNCTEKVEKNSKLTKEADTVVLSGVEMNTIGRLLDKELILEVRGTDKQRRRAKSLSSDSDHLIATSQVVSESLLPKIGWERRGGKERRKPHPFSKWQDLAWQL